MPYEALERKHKNSSSRYKEQQLSYYICLCLDSQRARLSLGGWWMGN